MSRIYNFNAGPSTLPLSVLEEASEEFVEFKGRGMSIIEMSHRSREYSDVHIETTALIKELLDVPDNYHILFLGGGATMQFSMIPMNLLSDGRSCDFTVTGAWAKKAFADAKKVGKVNVVFDGKNDNFMNLPDPATLKVSPDAAYLHMTSNETIGGIQWQAWPDTGDVPIVCDMSSDIMSRRIPVDKFGLIYAGAQKNLGPAGAALVLIRDDVLAKCSDDLPAYMSYKIHAEKDSLYNTPPVFTIYMIGKVMKWVRAQGGLETMGRLADERSSLIYDAIDKSDGFYHSPTPESCRSKMNVIWKLATEDLEKRFVADAAANGLDGLKGHRSVGGCRASIYNAMPVEGARAVADFMGEFARNNG